MWKKNLLFLHKIIEKYLSYKIFTLGVLSKNEKNVLYALTVYPDKSNIELCRKTGMKYPTFVSTKKRLMKKKYFRTINVPLLQNLGCELLAVIYSDFNPSVTAETRTRKTRKTIEVFDELFLSVGETQNGFSFSFSKNYSDIARINDIRIRVYTEMKILGNERPKEVIFPFSISRIYRFFDYAGLLKKNFRIRSKDKKQKNDFFPTGKKVVLTKNEKIIYSELISYPEANDKELEERLGISRHTISNARKKFKENNLIKKINIPNLSKLGYTILVFSHLLLHQKKGVDKKLASNPSKIFFASRGPEKITLSVYKNYENFRRDSANTMKYLRKNNLLISEPVIRPHSIGAMIVIKDMVFAPITRKILGLKG